MAGSGLAIVMFTDLVGSTLMRERLGDDVADEIGVEHDQIIGDALASTDGRLVKNLGDGALVVFDSSVDAVVAGQRIQEGVSLYNRQAEDPHKIGVRIGIHAGEVAVDDGDVIGLPVAVTSRVCDKAEGGQILITDTVRSLIGRRARFQLVSMGEHDLKGVADSVTLWSVEDETDVSEPIVRGATPFPAFLARGRPKNLVGREAQIVQLSSAHTAATSEVQVAAVIGEPGIGKTSLTSTWCQAAADTGATVVAGRCTPDAALPYQPFIEISRSILAANPKLIEQVGPAAGNIAQIVPGVGIQRDLPAPIQTDPDTTRYLMAEAFASLLGPTDAEPPVVVVLDDLHWADEHSVAVLSHLARRDGFRALIIGTYRDTDLVRSHPLPKLLSDLRREHRIVRIPLDRLNDDEVSEMISGYFGTPTAQEVVESIAQETQGNPFFVEEITTHLQDEGAIDSDGQWVSDTPIDDYGIPEGVREVIGRRLDRLGDDVVSTLEVAAVIGPSFSIDVAGAIAGLGESAIDHVVDAATKARIITAGDDVDVFDFSHALLRQTLYDGLPARRRIRIHGAVGQALEARGEPPAILLNHWLNANDSDRSLKCAIAAAEAARVAFAGSDTVASLELALEIWDEVEDPEGVTGLTRAQLLIRYADIRFDFGTLDEDAPQRVREELARDNADDATTALLWLALARHLSTAAETAGAAEAREAALMVVPKSEPNAVYAEVLATQASTFAVGGRPSEGVSVGLEALAMARLAKSEAAEQLALQAIAVGLQHLGDADEADRYYAELAELAVNTGTLRYQLIRYVNQASGMEQNGDLEGALELTEQGIERTSELGVSRWEAMLHGNASSFLFNLGRWDEADDHLNAVAPIPHLDFPQINLSLNSLVLAAERGDDQSTADEIHRLDRFIEAGLDGQMHGEFWACRVSDLRWHGDLKGAYAVGSDALETFDSDGSWIVGPRLGLFVVEVVADAVESGDSGEGWVAAARGWHERFTQVSGAILFRDGITATSAADLARAEGSASIDLWRVAVEAWGDQVYYGAKARWRLARALIEAGGAHDEAAALLDEAGAAADSLKARPLSEAVQATRFIIA